VPEEKRLQRVVHRAREGDDGQADRQAPRVDAEDETACHVERQPQEHVVQVARRPAASLVGGVVGEERQEAPLHLVATAPRREGSEPRAGHEHLGHHPLPPPRLPVGVEDAAAKDVEDHGVLFAFRVVGEVGREDVAHVGGVAGDEVAQAGAASACFEVAARAGEDAGGPVVEVMDVGDQAGEMPDYWPFGRLQRTRFLRLQVAVVEGEEAENKGQLYEQKERLHV